jgi:hypothetical protein
MKGSECESQIPGRIPWFRPYANPGRTVIIGAKRARVEMIRHGGDEGFKIFRHAVLLGWVVCRK